MCITWTITYASVRLFVRNLNTNSSHFIINKNNTVWHAVSSRFKPDKELTSSVLLKRKDVLFKTQSWVLYHDKVRLTHLVTWFMKEFSIYWCCISRENGGKSFVKIYVCFTTYKDSFTAMILLELLMSFWNLFVKPVRRTRISAYPHTRISAYPHIRIPAYPHIRIPAYPHTRIPAYPHTRIPAYPHTRISAYPRFPPNLLSMISDGENALFFLHTSSLFNIVNKR